MKIKVKEAKVQRVYTKHISGKSKKSNEEEKDRIRRKSQQYIEKKYNDRQCDEIKDGK